MTPACSNFIHRTQWTEATAYHTRDTMCVLEVRCVQCAVVCGGAPTTSTHMTVCRGSFSSHQEECASYCGKEKHLIKIAGLKATASNVQIALSCHCRPQVCVRKKMDTPPRTVMAPLMHTGEHNAERQTEPRFSLDDLRSMREHWRGLSKQSTASSVLVLVHRSGVSLSCEPFSVYKTNSDK